MPSSRARPLAVLALLAAGCNSAPPPAPTRVHSKVDPLQTAVERIDLLLAVDNTRSMADKQALLGAVVPELIGRLVDPPCLLPDGSRSPEDPGPIGNCPEGSQREFAPVLDLHIGVVSGSLGGHGGDVCPATETASCAGKPNTSADDHGHLLTRTSPCGGLAVATYESKSFLAWDPTQKLKPPGTSETGNFSGEVGVVPSLRDLVLGAGNLGCAYPSLLESAYRFLVDPAPPLSIIRAPAGSKSTGVDKALLAERADFLRTDSLLAIVLLGDEDDCSIRDSGQAYLAALQHDPVNPAKPFHLTRPRKECATNPLDPCCKPCSADLGACPEDPTCAQSPTLTDAEDPPSLRCFDQKRRFGVDLLYPVDRYVKGFQSPTIADDSGQIFANPIFDVSRDQVFPTLPRRAADKVIVAAITGVPWQDLARDPADAGKGPKTAAELAAKDASGATGWDTILGDPASYVPPKDAHMIASVAPRAGLPPPGSAPDADPIAGHEHSATSDLQYACVFDLPAPRECQGSTNPACECVSPGNDSALCAPGQGGQTLQTRAKAYPAPRVLSVLEGLGQQAVVGSACAAQTKDPSLASHGYRPFVEALIARLKGPLAGPPCLPKQLQADTRGRIDCKVFEARQANSQCTCDASTGRMAVPYEDAPLTGALPIVGTTEGLSTSWECICEIPQLDGAELTACQSDPNPTPLVSGKPVNGFCYVDQAASLGSPAVVDHCPADQQRSLRLVGGAVPLPTGTMFLVCDE